MLDETADAKTAAINLSVGVKFGQMAYQMLRISMKSIVIGSIWL